MLHKGIKSTQVPWLVKRCAVTKSNLIVLFCRVNLSLQSPNIKTFQTRALRKHICVTIKLKWHRLSDLKWSEDVPPEFVIPQLWFPWLIYQETAHKQLATGQVPSWPSPEKKKKKPVSKNINIEAWWQFSELLNSLLFFWVTHDSSPYY